MTRPSKSSSAKQPTALPQLAELPSRQFYTLKEAAAELNRLYGRTDIDENYILQLASMGKILIHWLFMFDSTDTYIIPDIESSHAELKKSPLTKTPISDDEKLRLRWAIIQDRCISFSKGMNINKFVMFTVDGITMNNLIFRDQTNNFKLRLINCFCTYQGWLFDSRAPESMTLSIHKLTDVNQQIKSFDKRKILMSNDSEILTYSDIIHKEFFQTAQKHVIERSNLYVFGAHFDQFKSGQFRSDNVPVGAFPQLNKPIESMELKQERFINKPERFSNAREQTIKALCHKAGLDSETKKAAKELQSYASKNRLEMPDDMRTIENHLSGR